MIPGAPRTPAGDEILTAQRAATLHQRAQREGELLSWCVAAHPSDYPDKIVVRPSHILGDEARPIAAIILADTIEEARAILPPGLICWNREPGDDPVIVESWM